MPRESLAASIPTRCSNRSPRGAVAHLVVILVEVDEVMGGEAVRGTAMFALTEAGSTGRCRRTHAGGLCQDPIEGTEVVVVAGLSLPGAVEQSEEGSGGSRRSTERPYRSRWPRGNARRAGR